MSHESARDDYDDAYAELRAILPTRGPPGAPAAEPRSARFGPTGPHSRRFAVASSETDEPITLGGPSPCDTCPRVPDCRAGGLACEQFAAFVKFGGTAARWGTAPRQPSAEVYRRIYRTGGGQLFSGAG